MAIALTNRHVMDRLGGRMKRLGNGQVLMKALQGLWMEYRRSQYLLDSSYRKHPMARRVPKRVWGRHSALFMSLYEDRDDA